LYSSSSRTASSHGFSTIWTSSSKPVDMVAEVVLIEPALNAIVDGRCYRWSVLSMFVCGGNARYERAEILGLYYLFGIY
jgi:hypothetical protein